MRSSSTSTDAGVGAQRPAHASHTLNNLPEVDAASSYSSSAPIKFAWNQEEGRSALEARRGEMVRGYGRCLPSPISLCPLTRRPGNTTIHIRDPNYPTEDGDHLMRAFWCRRAGHLARAEHLAHALIYEVTRQTEHVRVVLLEHHLELDPWNRTGLLGPPQRPSSAKLPLPTLAGRCSSLAAACLPAGSQERARALQ